jgi:KDO2-lipid IV(A) lauroyltransferase
MSERALTSQEPADARTGGTWTRAQRSRNALFYWTVRAALALADRVPEGVLCAAGRGIGRLAWVVLGRARRIARAGVTRALPDSDPSPIVRRSFATAGENLALALLLRRRRTRVLDRVLIGSGERALLASALTDGGAVFASAHFGPFELIAPAVSALGLPTSVVVRSSYDPRLDAVVDRHRVRHAVEVIHRGPNSATSLIRTLSRPTLLGLLVDLPGRGVRRGGTLFGRADRLATGPVVLVERLRVPLLIGYLQPATAQEPVSLAQPATAQERSPARQSFELVVERVPVGAGAQAAISHMLERAVRAWPEQWLWMGDPLGLAPVSPPQAATAQEPVSPPQAATAQEPVSPPQAAAAQEPDLAHPH